MISRLLPTSTSRSERLRSALVYLLTTTMVWQPAVVGAAGVTPAAGGASLDRAANGVPVVVIDTPSAAGVSRNRFEQFNVGEQGLILNNARGLTRTELGGYIDGNANLTGGSARIILNEVTGRDISSLRGYVEVGGDRADVVIANPNGIHCSGCGFLNTDHVTLSTGVPLMDSHGGLQGFDVRQGRLEIGSAGLNARNVARFDLIARSVTLAGELHADTLNVLTGTQQVGYDTLNTTEHSGEEAGDAPAFAIDSTALGGMYANRIRLIGTEQGVGMRLNAPVAAQSGDIFLTADGQLRFNQLSAAGDIQLAATDVHALGNAVAGERIGILSDAFDVQAGTIAAEQVTVQGRDIHIGAGTRLTGLSRLEVTGGQLANTGEISGTDVDIRVAQVLGNDGAILAAGSLSVKAGSLSNTGTLAANDLLTVRSDTHLQHDGDITAGGTARLEASTLETSEGSRVIGNQDVIATAETLTQRGMIHGETSLSLAGGELTLEAARVQSGGNVTLAADNTLIQRGSVHAGETLLATATHLDNEGEMMAGATARLNARQIINSGEVIAGEELAMAGDTLHNNGLLGSDGHLHVDVGTLVNMQRMQSGAGADIQAGTFVQAGQLLSGGTASVRIENLLRNEGLIDSNGLSLQAGSVENLAGATLQSRSRLDLQSDTALVNAGVLQSVGAAALFTRGDVDNRGRLISNAALDVQTGAGVIRNSGQWATGTAMSLAGAQVVNEGEMQATAGLSINAETLVNDGLLTAGSLAGTLQQLINHAVLFASGDMHWQLESLANAGQAVLAADGTQSISAQVMENRGEIQAGILEVTTGLLDNGGALLANEQLSLTLAGDLVHEGRIVSAGNMSLNGDNLTNHGHIQAGGLLEADWASLTNHGMLLGLGALDIQAGMLRNERLPDAMGHAATLGGGNVRLSATQLENTGGALLGATGDMMLRITGHLHNDHSDITATGDLLIAGDDALQAATARVTNHGGRIVADRGNLVIRTAYLDNRRDVWLLEEGQPLTAKQIQEMGLLALFEDNVALDDDDWLLVYDPGLYNLPLYRASSSSRHQWLNHWILAYTGYLNSQLPGLLSQAQVAELVRTLAGDPANQHLGIAGGESDPLTVNGGTNPLAETFYIIPRIGQLIRDKWPDRHERLTTHLRLKLEGHTGELRLGQSGCGTMNSGRGDWRMSSSDACDNVVRLTHIFTDAFRDLIDPASGQISAQLVAGGNIDIEAGTLDNRFSIISAGGDLALRGETLLNEGLASRQYLTYSSFKEGWHNTGSRDNYQRYPDRQIVIDLGESISSIIGAGGDVTLAFTDEIGNYTRERIDQQIVFDTDTYAAPAPPESAAPTDETPASAELVQWNLSDTTRTRETLTAQTLAILDNRSALYAVVNDPDHPYLIETNPLFATLEGLYGSDYLLDRIGLDPGQRQRRLGDSYYENTLIREAILAATGRRFLDPDISDDNTQFRRLMDNAASAAERMELAVGVGLTAEQINALQQDIIWLEERVVAGHTVLVPVLYLAPGSEQLTQGGAVIAGNNVMLEAGALGNSGTIAARDALIARAGNQGLVNLEGTLQAGGSLLVDSLGDIRNQSGTLQAGNITLRSQGDILIEAWSEQVRLEQAGHTQWRTDHRDAATVQAAGDVQLSAGGDIRITGSHVSGDHLRLVAGENLTVESLAVSSGAEGRAGRHRYTNHDVQQLGSSLTANLEILASAGEHISIVASSLESGGDTRLLAGGSVIIQSAANDRHEATRYRSSREKRETTSHHVTQQQSLISAGGDLAVSAGGDLWAIASRLLAGENLSLDAEGDILVLSAENLAYEYAYSEKKGDYGARSMRRDEIRHSNHVTTEMAAGGDMSIRSGGSQHYQAAQLQSGGDITLHSEGRITFEAVKDLYQESHERSQGDLSWQKMSGEGVIDETLRQSAIVAAGNLAISAANGISLDLKQIDGATIDDMIDAMVTREPELAWLKDMAARGDIDYRLIEELHDSWDYSSQSLGEGAALAITIVVTAMTAGAGGAVAGTVGMSGATASAVTGAVISSAASTAAVATINNGGRLDETFKSLGSKDNLKAMLAAGATAGMMVGVDNLFNGMAFGKAGTIQTDSINQITKGFDLGSWQGVAGFTLHNTGQAMVEAAVRSAMYGGSYSDALKMSMENAGNNVLSAVAFYNAGSLANHLAGSQVDSGSVSAFYLFDEGGAGRALIHATSGGAVAALAGGDFRSGAAAAAANQLLSGVSERLAETTSDSLPGNASGWRTAASQLAGAIGAAVVGGDVHKGAWVGKQADSYNRLAHEEELARLRERVAELEQEQGREAGSLLPAAKAIMLAGIDREFAERFDGTLASLERATDPSLGLEAGWSSDLGLVLDDLILLSDVLSEMSGGLIPDRSGQPILVGGEPLRYFESTEIQFNSSIVYAPGGVFPGYETGGGLLDLGGVRDILQLGSDNARTLAGADRYRRDLERQFLAANGGITAVSPEIELVLTVGPVKIGAVRGWFGGGAPNTTVSRGVELRAKYGHLSSQERSARIDELSRLNYERRLLEAIGSQDYVFRYLSEGGFDKSLRYGSVRGYMTTEFSHSSGSVARGAQIKPEWGEPAYGVAIPVDKVRGLGVARPFGNQSAQGWEVYTNSYPEAGSGGWIQFLLDPIPIEDLYIFRLKP